MKTKMSSSGRSWFGVVFGMIFFVAGMSVAYFTAAQMVVAYFGSTDWVRVPATIIELEFKNNYGSESTTHSVKGRYSYQYNGIDYSSSRISISVGSDNFSDYWQDLYSRLNRDRSMRRTKAWVNPDKPSEAVLDRTFRWSRIGFGALFASIFGGIGGFFAWSSWRKTPQRRPRSSLASDSEAISSNEKTGNIALLIFGSIFFAAGSFMSAMLLPKELAKENYSALLILMFVLVGAGILGAALKGMLAYRRFGPTPLFLDPASPGVGGEFGAWFILASTKLASSSHTLPELHATLCCLKRYRSGDSTETKILWSAKAPVHTQSNADGLKAMCKLDVPSNCKPSRESNTRSDIEWELSVEGDFSQQGMGEFSRSWEVFMYDTPSSVASQVSIPEAFLDKAEQNAQNASNTSALSQIQFTRNGYNIELLSAAGRYIGVGIIGILFGGIFAAMGVFTVGKDWWPGYIFIALGSLVGLGSVFSLGSAIRARFDTQAGVVKIRRSWFGIPFSSQECPILDASQFFTKRTSSSENGSKSTEYYAIYIRHNGEEYKVAESIEAEDVAESLKRQLIESLF